MSIFDVLNLIGGLCLFLFGMSLMGQALERRAGNGLKALLGKLTTGKWAGLLTGIGVTAIIQSSSATTVMVVGFVNSGLMTLRQSINVIMGANVGTTVTPWILSLAGIDGDSFFLSLLKPTSFTPVLALIGLIPFMMSKSSKRKDTGIILLGFATLMFGMDAMASAVSGLRHVPEFQQLFLVFTNPLLGMLAGAALTAVIQSSSASVGILQALSSTGAVTYGAAVPIIMGQNIGTCVTAILSSLGTNKNARRVALVHLGFNVIGAAVWLSVFWLFQSTLSPHILSQPASLAGIAVAHSIFNVGCTVLMFPLSGALEKIVCRLIPDDKSPEKTVELDDRLLVSPALALEQCKHILDKMAMTSIDALKASLECVERYNDNTSEYVRDAENQTDRMEDILGTFLVKMTSHRLNEDESVLATEYMKLIGDYERIADHAVNILQSAEEKKEKGITFSASASAQYQNMRSAVTEILDLSYQAFSKSDYLAARRTEALEQVINSLREKLRTYHIHRLQRGECTAEAGFIWSDLLTDMERVSDHCSNISGCILDTLVCNMNMHENLRAYRENNEDYKQDYKKYMERYGA